MSRLRSRVVLPTALGIMACATGSPDQARLPCQWESGFRISRDSIGPVATTDSIAQLRELCSARDTVYDGRIPSIVVPVPGGALFGLQPFEPTLDPQKPVTVWYVTGDGVLPQGVGMDSNWGDVERAYGATSTGSAEVPPAGVPEHAVVSFEQHPGLFINLWNLSLEDLTGPNPFDLDIYTASIPDSATIWKVMVRPAR